MIPPYSFRRACSGRTGERERNVRAYGREVGVPITKESTMPHEQTTNELLLEILARLTELTQMVEDQGDVQAELKEGLDELAIKVEDLGFDWNDDEVAE